MTAADFPRLFAEGWRDPDGAGGLLAFFAPHLHPGVQMTGPLSPRIRGMNQVTQYFELLFDLIPDLRGEVADAEVESDEVVRLTVKLRGTVGRREVGLTLRDRLVVRDGRLVLREARGLPVAMTLAILASPGVWRRAARLLLRVRWSAPAIDPAPGV